MVRTELVELSPILYFCVRVSVCATGSIVLESEVLGINSQLCASFRVDFTQRSGRRGFDGCPPAAIYDDHGRGRHS